MILLIWISLLLLLLFSLSSSQTLHPTFTNSSNSSLSSLPTVGPSYFPTEYPSNPTYRPSGPTQKPTRRPTTRRPSRGPVFKPTSIPTSQPSNRPTAEPSITQDPTPYPSSKPTSQPTSEPSKQPSKQPFVRPSSQPTRQPSFAPSNPSNKPTTEPTAEPKPTCQPSSQPTGKPSHTREPSIKKMPTPQPSLRPTIKPTTLAPTTMKPISPTQTPVTSGPTVKPTSSKPTARPSQPTVVSTNLPSKVPTSRPSSEPSNQPSSQPSVKPTSHPTAKTTVYYVKPSTFPSSSPSASPSDQPSSRPTRSPTISPAPTSKPTSHPSKNPSSQPSSQPSMQPTCQPTSMPTAPTSQPSNQPSRRPTSQPSVFPTQQPSSQPTLQPTAQPSSHPSLPSTQPSTCPTSFPTSHPTSAPTISHKPKPFPSSQPSSEPSGQPYVFPTLIPTRTFQPTGHPTQKPFPEPTPSYYYYAEIGFGTVQPTGIFEAGVSGVIELDPNDGFVCQPLEITISITFQRNISSNSYFIIKTPGITSGPCSLPVDGNSIGSADVPNAYDMFSVQYTEGSYLNNYDDSQLKITLINDFQIAANVEYSLLIDRSNGLRASCNANTSWQVEIFPLHKRSGFGGVLYKNIEYYPKRCFSFFTSIDFSHAHQQFATGVNFTFQLGFATVQDTVITVAMPGFSNKVSGYPLNFRFPNYSQNGFIGNGYSTALQGLTWTKNSNITWTGQWFEGDYSNNFLDSKIVFKSFGYAKASSYKFWINVDRNIDHLTPICGQRSNSSSFHVAINNTYFYVDSSVFNSTTAIGQACDQLSKCNGHGTCNYCTSTCECFDGYGSLLDVSYTGANHNNFRLDCSSRACPVGPAIYSLGKFLNGSSNDVQAYEISSNYMIYHEKRECSSNGVCNRNTGVCRCNAGYTGEACEKMACAATNGVACSGQGRCLSMSRLARASTALPLSLTSMDYASIKNAKFWDSQLGHMCVCDSSWSVGLKANQTQQSEYFGSSCQYRRCPSGDDPITKSIDETDCSGLNLTGGIDVGEDGNKCHVDCSNRGVCDYDAGVCRCFHGFKGSNCGTLVCK